MLVKYLYTHGNIYIIMKISNEKFKEVIHVILRQAVGVMKTWIQITKSRLFDSEWYGATLQVRTYFAWVVEGSPAS